MLILSFIINYEVPSVWRENRRRMWIYFLGEVIFPMFKLNKLTLLIFSLLGYLTILFTFSGSVAPAYGQTTDNVVPSLGKGTYEVIMFADYFCPPCRGVDKKVEPLLNELLATGKVKITFIDVPFHDASGIYAVYYLYAANANSNTKSVFHVRKILFDAAQAKNIKTEKDLVAYLKEQKISWKEMDVKPILSKMSNLIKENNIKSTPTCVIKYSTKNVKKLGGEEKIIDGLKKLKAHLATVKK